MKRIASYARFPSLLLLAACGDTTTAPTPDMTMSSTSALAVACADTVDSVYMLPAGLPAYDATHRGDVVRCAKDRVLTAAQINAALKAGGEVGKPVPGGVTVYRIGYRTDRSETGKSGVEGYATATLLIPDTIASPGAIVVTGHGTAGLAQKCAPSREDLTTGDAAHTMQLVPAGNGFITIATDYAGYAGGPVQGWSLTDDEAHSLLDAPRALKKILVAAQAPKKVAIVGHSQGGHAVLSAQALAKTYGTEGTVVGVAAFAPLWIPARSWGAVVSPQLGFTTTGPYAGVIAYGIQYFYGHGEILDGAGGGLTMFQPAKQQQVKTIMTTMCNSDYAGAVAALGTTPMDFYDSAWANSISLCAIADQCDMEPAKTWKARWAADRPPIDVTGAPVVVWHGQKDNLVTPDRAQCDIDKFATDEKGQSGNSGNVTVCIDPVSDHSGVVEAEMDWVQTWVSARLTGSAEPGACAHDFSPMVKCASPPPNQD